MRTISRDELATLIATPGRGTRSLLLLEALPETYYQQGHLPGARQFWPVESVREQMHDLGAADAPIVVYCASETCANSDQVAKLLTGIGYTDVRVYKGGKADWQAAGLPLEGAVTAASA